jgi:hypothetical protein
MRQESREARAGYAMVRGTLAGGEIRIGEFRNSPSKTQRLSTPADSPAPVMDLGTPPKERGDDGCKTSTRAVAATWKEPGGGSAF